MFISNLRHAPCPESCGSRPVNLHRLRQLAQCLELEGIAQPKVVTASIVAFCGEKCFNKDQSFFCLLSLVTTEYHFGHHSKNAKNAKKMSL
jgi:hypothetical protein